MPAELQASFAGFGLADWIFVGWSLVLSGLGLYSLTRGYALPGTDYPVRLRGLSATALSFLSLGLFFFAVYSSASLFTSLFIKPNGATLGHQMLAQFLGQMVGVGTLLLLGNITRGTVAWAPSAVLEGEPPPPVFSNFKNELRFTWEACTLRNWLGSFLSVVGLAVLATLAWKAFYWFCSLQGQVLPEEPQQLVETLAKWSGPAWQLWAIFLAIAIGAPVVEELAFRGTLYNSLKGWLPRGYAIVVTGLLFGIVHGSAAAFLPLFAFGCFLCIVRDRFGLFTCMGVHAAFNAHNFFWLLLAPTASTKF